MPVDVADSPREICFGQPARCADNSRGARIAEEVPVHHSESRNVARAQRCHHRPETPLPDRLPPSARLITSVLGSLLLNGPDVCLANSFQYLRVINPVINLHSESIRNTLQIVTGIVLKPPLAVISESPHMGMQRQPGSGLLRGKNRMT